MKNSQNKKYTVAIVAILKNEDQFVEEWVAYHRLLGISHFYIYNNDPFSNIQHILDPQSSYVTIIPWFDSEIKNMQTEAYNHFVMTYKNDVHWAAFIDGDEFINLKHHTTIQDFILYLGENDSVALNSVTFGHNGYYDVPEGLILESLTKRALLPDPHVKCISKVDSIKKIINPHYQLLSNNSKRVDVALCRLPTYPEDSKTLAFNYNYTKSTEIACINHYKCRSFCTWMNRPIRGRSTCTSDMLDKNHWTFNEESCFKCFIGFIPHKYPVA